MGILHDLQTVMDRMTSGGHSIMTFILTCQAIVLRPYVGAPKSCYDCLQGHIAATSPTFGHTLPSVFPEPNRFSPDRFKQDPNVKVSVHSSLHAQYAALPLYISS